VVRPDEPSKDARARATRGSGCTSPAGESPEPVSVGAPGSRPQARGEIAVSRAGCRKPKRQRVWRDGEQARGPQHEVKLAASTDEQFGGRAGHVAAKATLGAQIPERASGPDGVWSVARVQGAVRNRRDPSDRPLSRRGGLDKPKVKPGAGQRESEGIVVLKRPVQHNAGGGKGPCEGHVGGGGTCEGMAGQQIRSNNPRGRRPPDKVRQLQRRLWAAAKRSPERRFHAL